MDGYDLESSRSSKALIRHCQVDTELPSPRNLDLLGKHDQYLLGELWESNLAAQSRGPARMFNTKVASEEILAWKAWPQHDMASPTTSPTYLPRGIRSTERPPSKTSSHANGIQEFPAQGYPAMAQSRMPTKHAETTCRYQSAEIVGVRES